MGNQHSAIIHCAIFVLSILCASACDNDSKPDSIGYTTIQYSEPTQSKCPYCYGSGVATTFYGPTYCSNCAGSGQITSISFKSRGVKTLKKAKKCPTKNSTFECIDDKNNGIISTTDKCIHCEHMYYVHR